MRVTNSYWNAQDSAGPRKSAHPTPAWWLLTQLQPHLMLNEFCSFWSCPKSENCVCCPWVCAHMQGHMYILNKARQLLYQIREKILNWEGSRDNIRHFSLHLTIHFFKRLKCSLSVPHKLNNTLFKFLPQTLALVTITNWLHKIKWFFSVLKHSYTPIIHSQQSLIIKSMLQWLLFIFYFPHWHILK